MRRSLEERDAAVNLANAARDQAVQEVESLGHQLGATRAQLEQLQEEHNQILQDCQARQRCPMCAAPFELSDVWSATAFVRTGYVGRYYGVISSWVGSCQTFKQQQQI